MNRHPFLTKCAALTGLIIAAVVLAVAILYFTGMDFR